MVDLSADMIDVRDLIERSEELQKEYELCEEDDAIFTQFHADNHEEMTTLEKILDELAGQGGDEQWKGDWYPISLIADTYFTEYTKDMLEDCGDVPQNVPSYIAIDWEKTAKNIQVDYTTIEIEGNRYWFLDNIV